MRPEALLAGAAVAALLVTGAVAALAPGFVAEPDPADEAPPAHLDVAETTLAAGEVTGETATLDVTAFVRHRGGPAENVTVVVRATDAESGLVVDTNERDLEPIDDEREREVPVSVTVPREGAYDVETILYVDGNRADAASARVSGVQALTPPHAETTTEFHDFPARPSVEYAIDSVDDDRATLSVTSYLTNTGDDPEAGLRLVVTARQADSGVVADRAETTVGSVDGGRTATPTVSVAVPDGYGYYLEAELWRDGVLLASTRAVADLDPTETIAADEEREEVAFETGDFETDRAAHDDPDRAEPAPDDVDSQPGFGVALAVVALLGALLAGRRWDR